MRVAIYCLWIVLIFALAVAPPSSARRAGRWLTYRGAYFTIKYPSGFTVRPSQKTEELYDSVFFISADRSVEFYVFSPIWNGEPKDIEINPQQEAYVSQNVTERNGIKVRRATIKAKDGSYLRSFEDTENTRTNNRTAFGMKYRDQKAYDKYRPMYLTFKKSIVQFAD
jgi:hypothetical protein